MDKTLIIGVNNNFAPFEFLNKKGVPDGFTIDLMKAVAKKEDLKIKFIPDTWHNIRRGLEEQKLDAVTGMLYSKERDKIFDFSVPHFVISYAVFIRKETPIKSLADINGKEVIVVEDVYAHDWMMEKKITNSIIPVSEPIEDIQSDALVMADATQIHQIVMNLCTNARQAMLDAGGILRVRLSEVQLDEDQIGPEADLKPGKFIKLTVADTGYGVPPEFQNKIFDPFFTTKKIGEGTGMGLSVIHGIIKRYGGMINFDSEPGKGSTFRVFLPIVTGDASL